MTFSRSHAGMLAIVSIFTGVIAPIAHLSGQSFAFPMTDLQILSYILLGLLVVSFFLVSTKKWGIYSLVGMIMLVLIGYLSVMGWSGSLHTLGGKTLTNMSWGWIFLGVGSLSLVFSMLSNSTVDDQENIFFDIMIGLIGSVVLVFFSGLIIYISYFSGSGHGATHILSDVFGTGEVQVESGMTISRSYDAITGLNFKRQTDSISFAYKSESGYTIFPGNIQVATAPELVQIIEKDTYVVDGDQLSINGVIQTGTITHAIARNDAILYSTPTYLKLISDAGTRVWSGTNITPTSIALAPSKDVVAWVEKTVSGETLYKNGTAIGTSSGHIQSIILSEDGTSLVGTVVDPQAVEGISIMKNGVEKSIDQSGSSIEGVNTNGTHVLVVHSHDGTKSITYDDVLIPKEFDEVRETFIEKDGDSYAFFARPLGESKYCLFTRYRGNLCGLDGYMNPRLGADGGSILYAGLKGGKWSIYRNTDVVVVDTGYVSQGEITNDYAYFDITKPQYFLFIQKNTDGRYTLYKNGKTLEKRWNDVGLDVQFGYDNKIIMSARDETDWHIIEF